MHLIMGQIRMTTMKLRGRAQVNEALGKTNARDDSVF